MLHTLLSTSMAISLIFLPVFCFSFSKTKHYLFPRRDHNIRFNHRDIVIEPDIRLFSSANKSDNESDNDSIILPTRAKLFPRILRYRGSVDAGYGRGGKKLGVPTANLPSSIFNNALEDVTTGVYFGWAALERDYETNEGDKFRVYKTVVNVGYSPTFEGKENKEKIIEAHLISEDDEKGNKNGECDDDEVETFPIKDFYGVPMRLQLIGFLREEKKFDRFPELIAQIHADVNDARNSLDCHPYQLFRYDTFFSRSSNTWVGNGGGDEWASWESEPIQYFLDGLD